jgi:hypothetical protein
LDQHRIQKSAKAADPYALVLCARKAGKGGYGSHLRIVLVDVDYDDEELGELTDKSPSLAKGMVNCIVALEVI